MLAMTTIIAVASGLHRWGNLGFFAAVTVSIPPLTLVWALAIGRIRSFVALARKSWKTRIVGIHSYVILFLAFGFFNAALGRTELFAGLEPVFVLLESQPLLLLIVVQLISMTLPLLGFHPFVTIGLLGLLLQPVLNETNALSLCIVIIVANLSSSMMGTFNTTVTMMSGLLQVNPYQISRWNLGFALFYGTLGTVLGYFLLG